ncbi:MAG: class D sortase [Bacillota bacterium]
MTSDTGATSGATGLTGTTDTTPPTSPDVGEYDDYQQYPITDIADVRKPDGSIGVLSIPEINLNVTAFDGDTYTAMEKGIGHIASTSAWQGNIGLVGHNRGANDNFGKLKNLVVGDELSYTTVLGTKNYVVVSVDKISETDWSKLEYTQDNRITMITCVEDVSTQRLCVQAVEKVM